MARLSLSLLGPFQATLDGQPVTGFQSSKVRALLAVLAAEADHPHSRESLAALLWPDYPDALTYLRNALSNLRQVTSDASASPPFLLITRQTLQLNLQSSLSVDLREFQALAGRKGDPPAQIASLKPALDLFRGPFLAGLACDSDAFEEWALAWRERTGREQREALGRLSLAYAQTGEHELSIQAARRLLELEPWDEAAHRLVMQGLARNARRGAALAQYETCRRVLREALGVAPSAETQALAQSIRDGALESAAHFIPAENPSLAARPHLPNPLTSFIGREREIAEVRALLGHIRLLTLCGAGGCGKTRLAIAVAKGLSGENAYTHGVWWVDLSSISDPEQVLPTIAAAFSLAETGRTPLFLMLINSLRERKILLLIDNSEHLIEAVAHLAQNLLAECPGLQILATSREPLGVPGEVVWRVPSLAAPEVLKERTAAPAAVEELRRFDAVRLFEERARAALPGWSLDGNSVAVIEICSRLDGIPLAIELAAARVRVLSVGQISERLGDLFLLLSGGGRAALPRHQTLRACIDWSYALLTPPERALLRRLSVFSGGWTLEAAEAVGKSAEGEDVLDLLASLVDRSLVVVGQRKGWEVRYHLLDSIRQYAREKLVEAGEEEAALRAHLAYFLSLATRAEPELRGPDQVRWQALVRAELPNLRVALEWSLKDNPTAGLRIGASLFWFWRTRIDLRREGFRWLELFLEADYFSSSKATNSEKGLSGNLEQSLSRGWALNAAQFLLRDLLLDPTYGEQLNSIARVQVLERKLSDYQAEALDLFQRLGKPGRRGLAFTLDHIGIWQSNPQLIEESLSIQREEGDPFLIAEGLGSFMYVKIEERNFQQAKECISEALSLRQEIGDLEGIAYAYFYLGVLAICQNDFALAQKYCTESLERYQSLGYFEFIEEIYQLLAIATKEQGDLDRALRFAEKSLALSQELGEQRPEAHALLSKGKMMLTASPVQAGEQFKKALLIFKKDQSKKKSIPLTLEYLAYLATIQGESERAARLLGAAMHFPEIRLYGPRPYERVERELYRTRIESALGSEAFAAAYAEGNAMTFEQAVAYALEEE